ncbi:acetaldehyde dehydrogenase (acetylating) [Clostridium gasigenes]|uniref:Acetaldehyde dehydrogenase n=1 Tax=Clostridium gasigenes TaxID=94869 RepID=A0A1H0TRN8_9CLOT|nr:acetaldehyde dehydrogenase (acetylating) [Clostridium gasigenes]SDP56654.1 acetaldehyde dehydrogenase [Clostridium gasigenes]
MKKVKVGIIGTGNIGTDLLMKIQRSEILECGMFAGRNSHSRGIKMAEDIGIKTSIESIHAFEEDPSCCDIVFDATSASTHVHNAKILKKLGKFVIDLTPAKIAPMCVPVINLDRCIEGDSVNLITCGGQATVPIAYAISRIHPETKYIEIVASIASKSAGAGTRANIDEFTQTTRDALRQFSEIENTKAIITLNPAEPPTIMRNTVYAIIDNPNMDKISKSIHEMATRIKEYVPGYRVVLGPIYENGRVTTTVEVVGLGDYLPAYSGNLDIITCAAIKIAEEYAIKKIVCGGNV